MEVRKKANFEFTISGDNTLNLTSPAKGNLHVGHWVDLSALDLTSLSMAQRSVRSENSNDLKMPPPLSPKPVSKPTTTTRHCPQFFKPTWMVAAMGVGACLTGGVGGALVGAAAGYLSSDVPEKLVNKCKKR